MKNKTLHQISSLQFPQKEAVFLCLETYLDKKKPLALAISGGVDSMVLLTLVYQWAMLHSFPAKDIHVFHLNHAIRTQSIQEAAMVELFCLGCSFHTKTRDAAGSLTEEALRERRYACFKDLLKETKTDILLLGHHLDDRIETTLLNLLRGCNIQGFLGIKEQENHHLLDGASLVRPLLSLSKSVLLDLAKHYEIPYMHDHTNDDASMSKRNALRNQILPLLQAQEASPGQFAQSMANVYASLRGNELTTKSSVSLIPVPSSSQRGISFCAYLSSQRKELQIADLIDLLKELQVYKDISQGFLQELHSFVTTARQGYKYAQGIYRRIAHGKLWIIRAEQNFWEKTIDTTLKIPTLGIYTRQATQRTITDEKMIPCELRYAREGDMIHGKTRNKYAINHKIPHFLRNKVPVLVKNQQIVRVYSDTLPHVFTAK